MGFDDDPDLDLDKMIRHLGSDDEFSISQPVDMDSGLSRLAARYFLRMLLGKNAVPQFYGEWLEGDDDPSENAKTVLKLLGLPLPKPDSTRRGHARFLASARTAAKRRCARLVRAKIKTPALDRSIAAFRDQLALSDLECGLVALAALLRHEEWFLGACARSFGEVDDKRGYVLIADALRATVRAVENALAPRAKLAQAGLVKWDHSGRYHLNGKLECVSGLPPALFSEHGGPLMLLERQCRPAPAPVTTLADFNYLEKDVRLLRRLFTEALRRQTPGVNVLLYGTPGAGKTELVRALAAAVASELWEVGCEEKSGESVARNERMASFRIGQAMLRGRRNALLLFDEAEDVFPKQFTLFFGIVPEYEGKSKAWINQLLESNPVPTLWLSNSPYGIDPAHVRRFTYVLEVPPPPRRVRRNMLEKQLAPLGVPEAWLQRISADDRLVPGYIEAARHLLDHLGELSPEEARGAAEQCLTNTLRASGESGALKGAEVILTRYSPEFLNADADLATLAEGIVRRGAGRLCLYGAPGTGKSAFARHLAERAGKPLVYRRASDLLSCWVGKTEEKIAKMFAEATRDGAAVLLDEADSFLASREGAVRSWEITQVNELLTQMESFEGLFFASTNLMDRLDAASLRRFDLKIRFGYLKPEQARALLAQVLEEHGIVPKAEEADTCDRIAAISNLTPGDFAAVIRRARLDAEATTASWWVKALERECSAKPDAPRSTVGFLATRAS